MTSTDITHNITVSDEQLRAVARALSTMPYGAMVTMRTIPGSAETLVDDLVAYLDGLGNVLRMVGDRNRVIEADRDTLLRQRDAIRAFLGLGAQE